MTSTHTIALLSLLCLLIAPIFFIFYNQRIILYFPITSHDSLISSSSNIAKQIVTHIYYKNDTWKKETQELLWTDNNAKNIHQLINAWLTILDEERITPKKITLQSALISKTDTLYLSFDHQILYKENSIFNKWMIIEGILKTLVTNNIPINRVQFLVQHQQLNDQHLDFSQPWPIQGFL